MKPPDFGQQMQKQQQQMRDRQMQMGWQKKQQDDLLKKKEQEQKAALGQPSGSAPVFQLDPRFEQVENQVRKLRQDLESGRINEKKFQEKAAELMIEDQQGIWWMVGSESGIWYHYDGVGWTQATPPGNYLGVASTSGNFKNPDISKQRANVFTRLWNTSFTFLIVLFVFGLIGYSVGEIISANGGETTPIIFSSVIWLFGLWLSFHLAKKEWRK